MLIFNKNVSFGGEGQLSTGRIFSAEFLGQLSTTGKFKSGLILTGQILTTKVVSMAPGGLLMYESPSITLKEGFEICPVTLLPVPLPYI